MNGEPGDQRVGDAVQIALAREYGERTLHALTEMVRITGTGARLAARGDDWFFSDPDNAPGLACEGLIIKLGENVSRVGAAFEHRHPEVPWRTIKDMRRLTHDDETTDYEVVWSTLRADFPTIQTMIAALLRR